ncbi:unnamed protein product [Didymodactylos carnosus]|uniref:Uncharacterized protein n=1 Tax=Didymodactylos carnosus TaxID=1234261 RepID=A0A815EPR1_9BILA|nr:unnamed protein product [Didymodactylos carnosus]CAF4154688.1 unnamed protein product [Didymodactylos carnosus]
MKQKLIDMKSLIDASSILSKATLCDELFTLCKDVSYRQFGEKFDAMLTIIDTYYYVLKDYPKAFELLNEMKSAVKEEMNFATWDEKTEMKSRMHLFSHIIDETETSQDDHQLEFLSDCISEKLSMQTCKIDCFKDELWRSEDDSVDIQFQADSEKDTECLHFLFMCLSRAVAREKIRGVNFWEKVKRLWEKGKNGFHNSQIVSEERL